MEPLAVATSGLTKRFGEVLAVDAVDLDVSHGELVALLGPSGCGKTTTLRLLAGLERPDRGTIAVGGEAVAGPDRWVPPERRHIGLVFQDYALFPNLSVARNVGYGLERGARRSSARIAEMLELVGLAEVAGRRPDELSGGQRQRVALARALAPEPSVVLLDEPFSNLDAALRARVRADVREILRRAGASAIIVTHDQEEALSVADRVAVMDRGRIAQVGEPPHVYADPADPFVARFVGDAVLLSGTADGDRVATALGTLPTSEPVPLGAVEVVVRPEVVRLRLDGAGEGVVRTTTYYGHDQVIDVELPDGTRVRSRTGPGSHFEEGDRVSVDVVGSVLAFPVPADATEVVSHGHAERGARHRRRPWRGRRRRRADRT